MTQRLATRELERQLRKEPENLALRLRLAASYREAGRTAEAVQLYRSVAVAYHAQRRLAQAIAVCRSVLDIEPGQRETVALLAELEGMRGAEGEGVPAYVATVDSGPLTTPPPVKQPTGPVPTLPRTITGSMPAARPVTGQTPVLAPPVPAGPPGSRQPTRETPAIAPPGSRQPTRETPVVPAGTTPPPRAGQDASSPGMPAVRMLEKDVSIRELTPVRTLSRNTPTGTSPIGRRRPSTGPNRRLEPTTPTPPAGSGQRPSSPEDTPLPRPVPFHEVGEDSMAYIVPRTPMPAPGTGPIAAPSPIAPARSPRLRDLPPTLPAPIGAPGGGPPPLPPSGQGASPPAPPESRAREVPLRADAPARPPPVPPRDTRAAPPQPVPPERSVRAQTPEPFGDDAQTHVASVDTPAGPRLLPPLRAPTPPHDDEDAVTHVSGEWPLPRSIPREADSHRAPTRPAEALPSAMDLSADLDTRRMPRLSARELELLAGGSRGTDPGGRTGDDDEPTRPPVLPDIDAAIAGRASDHEAPWNDEITDPRAVPPSPPFRASPHPAALAAEAAEARPTRPHVRPVTDHDVDVVEESALDGDDRTEDADAIIPRDDRAAAIDPAHGVGPSPLFQKPFAETLQGLGPDGSAIEAPSAGRLGVFSTLPADAVAELERHMTVRPIRAGDIVLREGDRGESCFVIGAGEVRVLKSDPLGLGHTDPSGHVHGEPIEVARLGEGALFGEFALLADRRRHATVQAVTSGELYEIPRRLLRELAAGHPEVGPALERFYRERLLSTLITTAPFFAPMPEDQRAEMLARFSPVHADAGQAIVVEGEAAGGFYLIVLGAVDIMKRQSERRSLLLATLREGAYFGEMSLLTGHSASASVIAAGPVELARLGPKDFYDVVAASPRLWAAMRQEARHRELENARFVAGDSSAV
jgi:CRP-like cAMP-binding protein